MRESKKKLKPTLFIIISIVIIICVISVIGLSVIYFKNLFPGYFHGKSVNSAAVYIPLDYDVTIRKDFINASPELKQIGFDTKVIINNTGGYNVTGLELHNWSSYSSNVELSIFVNAVRYPNGTKICNFQANYYPSTPSRDDSTEIDQIKNYIKERSDAVATICNITLDWEKASWGISYND